MVSIRGSLAMDQWSIRFIARSQLCLSPNMLFYCMKPRGSIEKIKKIKQAVQDVHLNEAKVVYTTYPVTFSHCPIRNIQVRKYDAYLIYPF